MRFSIVVPIYNVGDAFKDMLESVQCQTCTDYELVLVDDGSTDGCQDVCDSYAKEHPQTKVIHKPNGGLISARRAGLKETSGEYILFVDADDMLKPDALKMISTVIDESGSDIVIYNADIFDGKEHRPFFEHELAEGAVKNKKVIYDKLFLSYSMNSMCLKAMKRDLIDIDTDYSEFYDCAVAEDLLQSVPIYIAAQKIYYLDRSLYDYRITGGMTHKCNPKYYWSNVKISRHIRKMLAGEGIDGFEEKVAFHILIAAYAGTTQMKYADSFDTDQLKAIREDSEFKAAWEKAWKSSVSDNFSKKQKLLLKLLHDGNWTMIKLLLKAKGGK